MRMFIILLLSLSISGCAGYHNSYKCSPGKGLPCHSITEINAIVDGKINLDRKKLTPVALSTIPTIGRPTTVRIPEETMQIWLAPYEDKDGTQHMDSLLNIVVTPASWQLIDEHNYAK